MITNSFRSIQICLWVLASHPDMCAGPVTAGRRAACDAHVHGQPLSASHAASHGGRFHPKREPLGARGDGQTEVLLQQRVQRRVPTGNMTNHTSHSNGMQGLRKEHLYKVLVIGDLGVGKTSIIRRYVHQTYSNNYRATIGVDFALKVLNWDSETVRLQLWDIAGTTDAGPSAVKNTDLLLLSSLLFIRK